ncbi:MAG: hypothetical protein H6711_22395 [Myxococcales bacterium]|nr:hypothetical protein [Myxococcales bacterium]
MDPRGGPAMIAALLAATEAGRRAVDVSAHLDAATAALWGGSALLVLFFVLRPELWRRLWFTKVDPRPAALTRIAVSLVVLWSLVDLLPYARFLFSDEGLWPTDEARKLYGGRLTELWDPERGFERWFDPLRALLGRSSLLHLRSDPPVVFAHFAAAIASLVAVLVGFRTRASSLVAWFLVNSIYAYSPIFYSGGDTVIRNVLFLGLFVRWGEAYSIDAWRRRRREILTAPALDHLPPLRSIAAWPLRLMMLQLIIIYCATGALKNGITWFDGTALYYALCLDHFYRHPAQIPLNVVLHRIGFLPLLTWMTKLWETLFPFAGIGLALQAFERERGLGLWGDAGRWRRLLSWGCVAGFFAIAAYLGALAALYYYDVEHSPWPSVDALTMARIVQVAALAAPALLVGLYLGLRRWAPRVHAFTLRWLLGRRLWLGFGVAMHVGIDLLMNVGTFVQVMLALYFVWLKGEEVDAIWRFVGTRALAPGEGGAPAPVGWRRWLSAPGRRLRHRTRRPLHVVLHGPSDGAIRRAALLRCWDLCGRLDFAEDPAGDGRLRLRAPGGAVLEGAAAGARLARLLPGLWIFAPLSYVPGVRSIVGALGLRALSQR